MKTFVIAVLFVIVVVGMMWVKSRSNLVTRCELIVSMIYSLEASGHRGCIEETGFTYGVATSLKEIELHRGRVLSFEIVKSRTGITGLPVATLVQVSRQDGVTTEVATFQSPDLCDSLRVIAKK